MFRIIVFATLTIVAAFFASPISKQANEQAKSESCDPQYGEKCPKSFWEKTADDPVATFTAVLAIFTFILAGVSIVQIYYVGKADKTARDAANAAINSNKLTRDLFISDKRPWLNISVYISGPVTFTDDGISITITVVATNIGNTPAVDTFIGKIAFHQGVAVLKQNVENYRSFTSGLMSACGQTMFPGDEITREHVIRISTAQVETTWSPSDGLEGTQNFIYICATYKNTFDETIHETSFAANVFYESAMMPFPKDKAEMEFGNRVANGFVIYKSAIFGIVT
jgi:hypothetical protein